MSNQLGRVDIRTIRCDEYCVDEDYSEKSYIERMTYAAFCKMCSQLENKFQTNATWTNEQCFELTLPGKIIFVGEFLSDTEYLAKKHITSQNLQSYLAEILTDAEGYFGVEFGGNEHD